MLQLQPRESNVREKSAKVLNELTTMFASNKLPQNKSSVTKKSYKKFDIDRYYSQIK